MGWKDEVVGVGQALIVAAGSAVMVATGNIEKAASDLARKYGETNSQQIRSEIKTYIDRRKQEESSGR
jgi:hypothetical protein